MSAARPPEGAKAPSGGSEPHAVGERGGDMNAGGLAVRALAKHYGDTPVFRNV